MSATVPTSSAPIRRPPIYKNIHRSLFTLSQQLRDGAAEAHQHYRQQVLDEGARQRDVGGARPRGTPCPVRQAGRAGRGRPGGHGGLEHHPVTISVAARNDGVLLAVARATSAACFRWSSNVQSC